MDLRRVLLLALIASLCLAAAVAIVAIVSGDQLDETSAKAVGTAMAIMVYTLTGLASATLLQRRPGLAWLAAVGLLAAALGAVIGVVAIWIGTDDEGGDDGLVNAAVCFLVGSLALGHISLLAAPRRPDPGSATSLLRGTAIALAALLAFGLILDIATEDDSVSAEAIAVIAILYVLATVLLPLVRRLEPPAGGPGAT